MYSACVINVHVCSLILLPPSRSRSEVETSASATADISLLHEHIGTAKWDEPHSLDAHQAMCLLNQAEQCGVRKRRSPRGIECSLTNHTSIMCLRVSVKPESVVFMNTELREAYPDMDLLNQMPISLGLKNAEFHGDRIVDRHMERLGEGERLHQQFMAALATSRPTNSLDLALRAYGTSSSHGHLCHMRITVAVFLYSSLTRG